MKYCPVCNAEVEEGAVFCPACGKNLNESDPAVQAPVSEEMADDQEIIAPVANDEQTAQNCDTEGSPAPDCEEEGHEMAQEDEPWQADTQPLPPKTHKKRRLWIGLSIALGVLLLLIGGAAVWFMLSRPTEIPAVTAYVENGEIWLLNAESGESYQLTEKLVKYDFSKDSPSFYTALDFTTVSPDGKYVIYPDESSFDEYGTMESADLYLRPVSDLEKQAVKIAKNVCSYYYCKKTGDIYYLKGDADHETGDLYVYDFKQAVKLADDISAFEVSTDGKRIAYTKGTALYLLKGKEDDRIATGITELCYFDEDLTSFAYLKEDILYYYTVKEGASKIATDVTYFTDAFDGKFYYEKNGSDVTLYDLIEDDLKEADEKIEKPEKPDVTVPVYEEYGSMEKYEAAVDDYNEQATQYNEKAQAYNQARERNILRNELLENDRSITVSDLYYWDGEKETKVAEGCTYSYYHYGETPLHVAESLNIEKMERLKLSEIDTQDDIDDIGEDILDTCENANDYYVIVGGKATKLEAVDYAFDFTFTEDGSALYYCADYVEKKKEENSYATLYKISLADGKVGKPEKIAEECRQFTIAGGAVICFKTDDCIYRDGEMIMEQAEDITQCSPSADGTLTYFLDEGEETEEDGEYDYTYTLYVEDSDGKVQKLSEDVHDILFTPDEKYIVYTTFDGEKTALFFYDPVQSESTKISGAIDEPGYYTDWGGYGGYFTFIEDAIDSAADTEEQEQEQTNDFVATL